jgi:GDP-4-dehydro-6-deoxy-D-mannose reductase
MAAQASDPGATAGVRVLVTGGAGFVGGHLIANLRRTHADWRLEAPPGPGVPGGLDITDAAAVDACIARIQPDVVVHLAAIAAVTDSVRDPRLTWKVNLDGALNIVLALQDKAPKAHLLFVSSAEVYGESLNGPGPTDETALLQPVNPYAASKAAADLMVRQAAANGLSATIMRPFNHTGAGQGEAFVAPNFAGQIARIEAGLAPPVIEVGSLDDERDFLDVGDVVRAYVVMLERRGERETAGVFNVASGRPVRIGDLLEQLLSMANVRIEVRVDPARLRSAPITRVVGDATRLRALGWAPTVSFAETLSAVLADRRQAVAKGGA